MELQGKESYEDINFARLRLMLVKRKKFFIGLMIVIVLSSTVVSLLMPKIYRGETILKIPPQAQGEFPSTRFTAKEIVDIIGKIDQEKKALISPKHFGLLTKVKLEAIRDSKDKILLTIEAKSKTSILESVTDIVAFINDIDIVKASVSDERELLQRKSFELSSVIKESLEHSRVFSRLLKEGRLIPVGFNPVEVNKKISDVMLEKMTTDQALNRLNGGISIAKQPYISNKPVRPNIVLNIVLAGIGGIFLAVVLILILEYRDRMRSESKSEQSI